MGCDIHFFTEVKIDGKWHCHGAPDLSRWYLMFEKMAGVRGNVEKAIVSPKGIPDDLSDVVAEYWKYWDGDAHTPSWLNAQEIKQLEQWLVEENNRQNPDKYYYPEKEWGYVFGGSFGDFKPSEKCAVQDVRFVFWFDN